MFGGMDDEEDDEDEEDEISDEEDFQEISKKISKVTAGDKKATKDGDVKGFESQDLDKSLKAAKKNAVKNTIP